MWGGGLLNKNVDVIICYSAPQVGHFLSHLVQLSIYVCVQTLHQNDFH